MKLKSSLLCLACLVLVSGCDRKAAWDVLKSLKPQKTVVHETQEPLPAITNGISVAVFKKIFGEPIGSVSQGAKRVLVYNEFKVTLENGTIVEIPDTVHELYAEQTGPSALDKIREATKRIATPRETQEELAHEKAYPYLNAKNKPVDHALMAAPGQVTVLVFCSTDSAAGEAVRSELEHLLADEAGVALQPVEITSWNSDTAKHYHITTVPDIRVLDRFGYLVAQPITRIEMVEGGIDLGRVRDALDEARRH